MATAYLVGTPFSSPLSWANISAGAGGTFGGLPNDTSDVIIDAGSPSATADVASLLNSITVAVGSTATITQSVEVESNTIIINAGTWDTSTFGVVCNGLFSITAGSFDASIASRFLIGSLSITGGVLTGSPQLPTIDTGVDTPPTTVEDAIEENAKNPFRVRGDEGEVEMHMLRDQIEADKYIQSKKQLKAGVQGFFSKIKPSGTV